VAAANNLSAPSGSLPTNKQFAAAIPNPDSFVILFDNPANNYGSARMQSRNFHHSRFGWQVDLTNSFTVEGGFRLYGDPSGTTSLFFVAGNRRSSNGWMLTLRRDAADEKTLFHLYAQTADGTFLERFFPDADMTGKRERHAQSHFQRGSPAVGDPQAWRRHACVGHLKRHPACADPTGRDRTVPGCGGTQRLLPGDRAVQMNREKELCLSRLHAYPPPCSQSPPP